MRGCLLSLLASAGFFGTVQGYRGQLNPNDKVTTSDPPQPWHRTVYSTKKEIVTPTVIAGVTFSAKPLATPDPLQPWVSLQKDGRPKTISPEVKNGRTVKGRPDYSTYFQTATTITWTNDEFDAHNMGPDDTYEEVKYFEEDDTYVSLNPIVRCTPDNYRNKGITKDVSSVPFCSPEEGSSWKLGTTYFATWYTHFFKDEHSVEVIPNVRLHLSYVREKAYEKGMAKRDVLSFFTTEWLKNVDGVYAFEIDEEWFGDTLSRKVLLSIQPESIPDDEFDPLENGVSLYIDKGTTVGKKSKEQRALEEAGITTNKWWYVAVTMPTVVIIALVLMYFFLYANTGYRDFSDVTNKATNKKHRVLGRVSDMKRFKKTKNHKYSELPSYKPSKQN